MTTASQTQTAATWTRGEKISCGCCRGPENDRCCCHFHQDISRGLRAHKCSLHCDPQPAASVQFVDVSSITEYGLTQKLSNSVRVF